MPQTATQRVDVSLGDRSYPIDIGAGLLTATGALDAHVRARDVLLLTNTTVGPLYAEQVTRALGDRRVVDVRLPDGEQHKTLDNVARVLDVLVANRFGRDSLALALGGGVVGDLCGFTAACYQRGIDFAQLPTTLLAQVDSSVGGKTGVNHPGGKNLIGAFHQPKFVLADTATLATLPPRELRAGLAEVIKYGLVFDPDFLAWLEDAMPRLLALDPDALAHAIRRSCELKADVVRRDEREQGERALLNLGHTFGHAIESATGYTEWLHGEAVATGMLIAADLSRNMGLLRSADVDRVRDLLRSAGLGTDAPRIGAARALDYMRVDKKVKGGRIRLILLEQLGRGRFTADYPDDALDRTLTTISADMDTADADSAALAPYAAHERRSRGRRHPEAAPRYRGEFQRDRDRIVHSTAFRRLVYKTQVFVNHEGDLYRTRLTHSMEVAQIARSIARALRLNETLTEAICLAHDLGHTPFGHAGQDALNERMRAHGGFEHNLQSLRVVDELEDRYAEFRGLNLTFECREGILKHASLNNARLLGELGERFLQRRQPGLEAQIANLADEIAYNNHDVDDGLRAGLLTLDQLESAALVRTMLDEVRRLYPGIPERRLIHEVVRRMINRLVTDVIESSTTAIAAAAPRDIDDVRALSRPLIAMSEAAAAEHLELKRFLRENLYLHYRVARMTRKARRVVSELFDAFMDDVQLMPPEHQEAARAAEKDQGAAGRARAVADYIAGMTDRYAIGEHHRMFTPGERS